MQSKKRLC